MNNFDKAHEKFLSHIEKVSELPLVAWPVGHLYNAICTLDKSFQQQYETSKYAKHIN